ncbi:MAG TPA: type II secretion system F family protein [candidate division Zixibacteria bacterium]|nr:type II secretion system F family protein [candidate division Zixibacteria bacterium]
MPQFRYEGKSVSGQLIEGVLEAKSAEELAAFLRRQRITVTKIKKKPKAMNMTIGTGVKAVEISRFTRQFAVMIEAGLPLVQCLDILADQTENPVLRTAISKIRDTVSGGSTLAAALAKHKKIFNDLYVNMIEAGEMGGALESILRRLADYQEKADRVVRKVKGALIYPIMMIIMTIVSTFAMLTFIIPTFADMFKELGGELPKPTQVVIALSNFIVSNLVVIFLALGALVAVYVILNSKKKSRFYIDMIKLGIPLFGDLLKKSAVARFCRTLGTLLRSGVNLIDALNITAKTAGNLVLTAAIHKSMISISEGETITAPLAETKVFPPMVIQMISVGEKTGNMDEMLEKIADFYDEEVDASVDALTSMIEPIIIVFMAVIIGGLLIAMYLPMFDIVGQIK